MKFLQKGKNDMSAVTVIFFFFFFAGILITILWNNCYGNHIYILSEEMAGEIANFTWNNKLLFYQCLIKRVSIVVIILFAALSGIGLWAIRLYAIWFSFSMGALMENFTLQYGISGIFLFIIGIFPHYFFYIPAYILLFKICYEINEDIKQRCRLNSKGKIKSILEKVKILCIIFGVVIIGSALESYVNPPILCYFLNLFF